MFSLFRSRAVAPVVLGLAAIFAVPSAAAAQAAPTIATPVNYKLPAQSPALPAAPVAKTLTDSGNPSPSVPAALQPFAPVHTLAQPPRSLEAMVASYVDYGDRDEQGECLAKAVYFEARSESLEGQLAVANVVLNRARSGVYPTTICEVVTQPWQFSFIRQGKFPTPDRNSNAWREAAAIAAIAQKDLMQVVPQNVLWYHADYVAPSWGRRLTRVAQIGAHIFYN